MFQILLKKILKVVWIKDLIFFSILPWLVLICKKPIVLIAKNRWAGFGTLTDCLEECENVTLIVNVCREQIHFFHYCLKSLSFVFTLSCFIHPSIKFINRFHLDCHPLFSFIKQKIKFLSKCNYQCSKAGFKWDLKDWVIVK